MLAARRSRVRFPLAPLEDDRMAQLVAHLLDTQEVAGSIPAPVTEWKRNRKARPKSSTPHEMRAVQ